jgi:drug/metabolite transporter (DMT)-like permease
MLLYVLCCIFASLLAAGQLMFKFAATDISAAANWRVALFSPWLLGALALYALTTALWILILTQMPLSKAYPFALLGAAIVPALAHLVLSEPLPLLYIGGMAAVILGLAIIQLS